MIIDFDQEAISQRKNKLKILLNRNNNKQRFICYHQHQIIKQVFEQPKRVFSYSRSIRHFQEIMSKTGSISLNKKAITLFLRRDENTEKKSYDEIIKATNSKLIQTDNIIQDEYGFRTERNQQHKQQSPYIKQRKFSQHLHIKDKIPKQPYIQRAIESQIVPTSKTNRSLKKHTFQNEILQQKVTQITSTNQKEQELQSSKSRQKQIDLYSNDNIFATITHRY
ncbi:unnamed protein product [Paramecium pentaurelia]|uniref:Uncharacterized protein n=1 Tax=Paramecium pentaurelia TaxID=43138 RepID=A0A8S1XX74_9CILI|nr:unnamed protein product [Paramecium pentaurelia]